jgi:polyisoprenyl-teichoic acid--peptidoglycan teichoic acid transferase
MPKPKVDLIRLLAVLTMVLGVIYFYANLFAPGSVPGFLRIGVTRQPTTILILGTDLNFSAETGKQIMSDGRTDSIILMRVDPIHHKIIIFSIPRDSFVEIPGYGFNKINAANVFGGVELTKKTVSALTGVHIDYYIKLDPTAVTDLVNLLGGIDIYVEKDMYYVDRAQDLYIDLKQGWHKLSGLEAQDYMRFRHDQNGDLGRIERQQKFLQTLFINFAKPSNLMKAPSALIVARRHVQTDLSLSKLIRLVNFARMLTRSDILSFTAAGEDAISPYAGSILVPDREQIKTIVRERF